MITLKELIELNGAWSDSTEIILVNEIDAERSRVTCRVAKSVMGKHVVVWFRDDIVFALEN